MAQTVQSKTNSFLGIYTALLLVVLVVVQWFFPWWTLALVSAVIAFFLAKSGGDAFGKGFWVNALIWLVFALKSHFATEGILSQKVAQILPLGGSVAALTLLSVLIVGLVGGMASLSGFQIKQLLKS
ncbi:hypothetical protein [Flectobacillus major]|uniref:hypothetical protein n=1 Tax=Flectobacillus major TaxID=103 RepID=UPI0004170991|nr:hypothetical protein [Flectobacillus major]